MKKNIGLVVVASALVFFSSADADGFEWNGTEFDIVLGGNVPGDAGTSLFFSVEGRANSSTGNIASFARIGPRNYTNEFHGVYFLVGVAGGLPENTTSFLVTVGNELRLLERHLRFLIEINILVSETLNYYGVYAVDLMSEALFAGFHAEQINLLITAGPHLGFSIAWWRAEIQYNIGTREENEGQSVRFVYNLIF